MAYTMPGQCEKELPCQSSVEKEKQINGKIIYRWFEWKSYSEIRKMYANNWYLMVEGRPRVIIEDIHFYHVQVGIN